MCTLTVGRDVNPHHAEVAVGAREFKPEFDIHSSTFVGAHEFAVYVRNQTVTVNRNDGIRQNAQSC